MNLRNTRTTILNQGSPEQKREEIRQYFHATYDIDQQLYETLAQEKAFYLRPEPLRHPLIFYLGHTASFYINKLIVAKLITQRVNPRYESMFAIGVDEMSWDDLNEAHYDWPMLAEVKAYRDTVRGVVDGLIRTLPLNMPITWDNPFWAILMGIEHERIHLETSSVIIRRLPLEMVQQLPLWDICPLTGPAPANSLVAVKGGKVVLGKSREHPLYGWDNEFGQHEFQVEDFAASRYLVSNQQYLEFVQARGYEQEKFWTPEGWKWVSYSKARHPLFWVEGQGDFKLRTMAQVIAMPWDWPVEVNYLEAKAFCNWMAETTGEPIRLPTEDEWYHLHDQHKIPDQPYWQQAPGNINLEHWASACPVGQFPFGDFFDLVGNVWQWTETPITGFEGFEVHPYYDDFSTPTFDTQHNLIKGGSWISTGNEATRDSRYAFRRHFFQHAGFRYVRSKQPLTLPQSMYETDTAVAQYCEGHYGGSYFNVPPLAPRLAELCVQYTQGMPRRKALDLGCAVGRSTFELARHFAQVTGIDFSARFIRIALQMKEKGVIHYELVEEGEVVSYHEASLGQFQLERMAAKVDFAQGDAQNLKGQFNDYDLILAANLLDRLGDPRSFLENIHQRLRPGGVLVLASPYTWLEQYTKKDNWLGGYRKNGEPQYTLAAVREILSAHFTALAKPQNLEFVLRETGHKFQHIVTEVTVWQRNPT